jgi:DNA-binding FrmR family transcriptional regulator
MINKHGNSAEVISRLSKIEGHIRGVIGMVETEKSCDEILLQFSAIQAAIKKAGQIILVDHFEHCILDRINDEDVKSDVKLFQTALSRLLK